MIRFNKDNIRVRCLECMEDYHIPLEHRKTDKEQRTMGYEYEHFYIGNMTCVKCFDEMVLELYVYEYPKNFINWVELSNSGCLDMKKVEYKDDLVIL